MKKIITALFVCLMIFALAVPSLAMTTQSSEIPYDSYVYNNDNRPVSVPAPYVVQKTVTGSQIGVGKFQNISDIFQKDGLLYISDKKANRIVITDTDFNLVNTIEGFDNNGKPDKFSQPVSCFVNDKSIYIADSKNARIVVLDKQTFSLVNIFGRPEISLLEKDYTYSPIRVVVDNADRMYVLAEGINSGMIRLDKDGTFTSFFGAPSVQTTVFELLWRQVLTKAQRKQMSQFVPTEYSSVLIDEKGFVYGVSATSEKQPVAKINTNGENVMVELQGENDEYGDAKYLSENSDEEVQPYFSDITIGNDGTYTVLDSKRGKIYVYSNDGYLLYAFGAQGNQKGTFSTATAIEQIGDKLYVTDGNKGTITVFRLSDFGKTVRTAILCYNSGEYDKSYKAWQTAYSYCSNYTPAISGMAKIDIVKGKTTKAMNDLKKVHDHDLYSKAFESYRNDIIRQYFIWAIAVIVGVIVLVAIFKKPVSRSNLCIKYHESDYYKKQKFASYTMLHPFDGYWDLKREKRGDTKTAVILLIMFTVCYALRTQFSGYITTKKTSDEANVIYSVVLILVPILFYMISNWCFSTLMEGEGTFMDIFRVTCYALKPYIILSIPLLLLSHCLTAEEAMFYGVLDTACWIWTLALFFFGMMITHNYSLSKALLTAILSLVGICIIIFILLLVASIVQNAYDYFYGIVKELQFRTY